MEANKEQGKRIMEVSEYDDEGEEDEEVGDDNKKKGALTPSKRRVGGSSTQRSCQVEDCTADMTDVKPYHRRHKVCEYHAKAAVVILSGIRQRFCQQCSSYHGHFSFSHNLGPDRGRTDVCKRKRCNLGFPFYIHSLAIMYRFHELSEFDEAKRSCRRRLAGHNERRRKSSYESQ